MTPARVLALLALGMTAACGAAVPQGGTGPSPAAAADTGVPSVTGWDGRTGPLDGSATGSCVERYTPEAVAGRAFSFDGTVTKIGPGTTNKGDQGDLGTVALTFKVHEWWRGGDGASVTVDIGPPLASNGTEPAAYEVGTRLLVSGEARWGGAPLDDPIAWACGFTRYYDPATADAWREASR